MAKKRTTRPAAAPKRGKGDSAGVEFQPAIAPKDAGPDPFAGAAPLGLPISHDEYERLQKHAADKPKPPTGCAQEDTADGGP